MSPKAGARPHGQIRRSQLITTFGPGAMLDLPNHSVLVGGLEDWSPGGEEIFEPRLIEKLTRLLSVPSLRLIAPPPDQEVPPPQTRTLTQTGIKVWQFPEWFITQEVTSTDQDSAFRSRMLVHRSALTRGKFIDPDKKKRAVVPVRFVRACRAGHIGDIDWYAFVHSGETNCRRRLWLDERGTSGDIAEIFVRCDCGAIRNLSEAVGFDTRALGHCDGQRPWLGSYTREHCNEPNRLLIRTASNAYFPQQMTVISLPDRRENIRQAVDVTWDFMELVENIEDLRHERKRSKVKAALDGLTDEEVFAEIQARRGVGGISDKSVKQAELETLVSSKEELGNDHPDGVFFARALPRERWDKPWMRNFERVVLVHRLREVMALLGFTRFEAAAPDIEGELDIEVRRAALAREVSWLPAVENKGEGIFMQFKQEAIDAWIQRENIKTRGKELEAGFERWRAEHHNSRREFPGLPYMMLHSFSHLLRL